MSETVSPQEVREQPVPAVVEKLEELLELANSGSLRGFAFAGLLTGDGRPIYTTHITGESLEGDLYLGLGDLQFEILMGRHERAERD